MVFIINFSLLLFIWMWYLSVKLQITIINYYDEITNVNFMNPKGVLRLDQINYLFLGSGRSVFTAFGKINELVDVTLAE